MSKHTWGHSRPFNAASNYIRKVFGSRIQKVTINAGFTCPNRDGTKATGGCAFCNNRAFNPSYNDPAKPISQQIEEGIRFHKNRYRSAPKYLAYFQAFSNTYGNVEHLGKLYWEALNREEIAGLVIGTRPDCIDDSILDLLEDIAKKYYLVVEFGIESVYNKTLDVINRGHTYEESVAAIEKCDERNITTGGHMIFGLPGETRQMMIDSAKEISKLQLKYLKLHQLQIIKNTEIGREYIENPSKFKLFELEEYIEFVSEYLCYLNPEIVVERLAGEAQPNYNLNRRWSIRYDQVLQMIEKYMTENNLWQGKLYNKK